MSHSIGSVLLALAYTVSPHSSAVVMHMQKQFDTGIPILQMRWQ